jgi:hypothetical protein
MILLGMQDALSSACAVALDSGPQSGSSEEKTISGIYLDSGSQSGTKYMSEKCTKSEAK